MAKQSSSKKVVVAKAAKQKAKAKTVPIPSVKKKKNVDDSSRKGVKNNAKPGKLLSKESSARNSSNKKSTINKAAASKKVPSKNKPASTRKDKLKDTTLNGKNVKSKGQSKKADKLSGERVKKVVASKVSKTSIKPATTVKKANKQKVSESTDEYFIDDIVSSAKVVSKKKKREYENKYEDPDWAGNEDETGSVDSGVMEEDFCFECGISTLNDADNWSDIILCDKCDAEYHLKCAGFDIVPRKSFVCRKCVREEQNMSMISFEMSGKFKIPKKKLSEKKVVYSPSRPLESAWQECVNKGLMVVADIFPYEVMRVLTHGTLEHRTKSGRLVDIWQGALKEVPQRLLSNAYHNVVDRQGRYDLKLPDFLVDQLKLPQLLEPILAKLRTIMGNPAPQLRTHDIIFVPVGSSAQEWHADDSMRKHKVHRYFTILIHLNPLDNQCGGTEVWSHQTKKSDMIRARPGDALVFNGSLLHRGQANNGFSHRFFYYASFACGNDMNVMVH